jgi:hypothetical protein
LPYTSDRCGEFSSLLCPVCNRKKSRLASQFPFCKHWKNGNIWWLSEATIGIPLFRKNDRARSKDSSLDNPSCDECMIPR